VEVPAELLAVDGRAGRAGVFELGQAGDEVGVAENRKRP
jgi:hypothetical protein